MDPRHLKNDELEYEFGIRGIPADLPNRMDVLLERLNGELTKTSEVPRDSQRLSRVSFSQELRHIEGKCGEIGDAIIEVTRDADDSAALAVHSRLLHMFGRVDRLRAHKPEHISVGRLMERVQFLMNDLSVTRESFGAAGETIDDTDDARNTDIVENNTNQRHTGTIPRTTAMNTPSNTQTLVPSRGATSVTSVRPPGAFAAEQRYSSLEELLSASRNIQRTPAEANLCDQFGDPAVIDARRNIRSSARRIENQMFQVADYDEPPPSSHRPASQQHSGQRSVSQQHDVRRSAAQQQDGRRAVANDNLCGAFRISKWSLRFSGAPNSLRVEDFLFRLERQARLHGVHEDALVIGIGDLLVDRAADWYWTFQKKFDDASWEDLKSAFVRRYSPRHESDHNIRVKIENRKQRMGETFGDFCQDVETLSTRLVNRMSEEELVETLRRNMHMELRKALWRQQMDTVDDLLEACNDYEELCEDEERQMRYASRRSARVSEMAVEDQFGQDDCHHEVAEANVNALRLGPDRNELSICWNCRDIGHIFSECKQPRTRKFCFGCGQNGLLKAECPKCAGNGRKDVQNSGASRPSGATPMPQLLRHPQQSMQPAQQVLSNNNPFNGQQSSHNQ